MPVVTPQRRRGCPRHQVVDPSVSRQKFEREVEALRRHEADYRRQGWLLLSAVFPEVFLVLTVPQLRPAPVLFGVLIDFMNYDVDPPSVRLVNPWTRELLRPAELLSPLPRLATRQVPLVQARQLVEPPVSERPPQGLETPSDAASELPGREASPLPAQAEFGHLMQWWPPDGNPFLCLRGVREYHRNPAHTGDAWLLHRMRGEGTLAALLSAIHDHGRAPIQDYTYEFVVQTQRAQHNAFAQHAAARVNGFLNVLPGGHIYFWPALT
jgi:hypothetical protein